MFFYVYGVCMFVCVWAHENIPVHTCGDRRRYRASSSSLCFIPPRKYLTESRAHHFSAWLAANKPHGSSCLYLPQHCDYRCTCPCLAFYVNGCRVRKYRSSCLYNTCSLLLNHLPIPGIVCIGINDASWWASLWYIYTCTYCISVGFISVIQFCLPSSSPQSPFLTRQLAFHCPIYFACFIRIVSRSMGDGLFTRSMRIFQRLHHRKKKSSPFPHKPLRINHHEQVIYPSVTKCWRAQSQADFTQAVLAAMGLGADLAVRSVYYSCRRPEVGSQHPYWVIHNHL